MAEWQWLKDLALPREAEAKVVYSDKVLRDLDASLQQGTAQPVDEAGQPYPPRTVQREQDAGMRLLRQLRLLPAIMPGGVVPPPGR